MAEKTPEFTLEQLKGLDLQGRILYTNATETGIPMGDGGILLAGPLGIDQVLMDLGFEFIPEMARSDLGLYWMERFILEGNNRSKESLKYHPLGLVDSDEIKDKGFQTRVNFFGHARNSDAIYVLAQKLLEAGYEVAVPPLNRNMDKLHYFKPTDEAMLKRIESEIAARASLTKSA